MVRNRIHQVMFGVVPVLLLASGCAHKYENPITKDTQQPDKVLFDTSIDDIEHGRYERARLTLQTMMNTYDTSEFLAKAKLAVADSWKREGGAHGMAQAEAEYKDFILFYPNMEESSEAQYKICEMQYLQMDKADRDNVHARLGDAECKDVLLKWPNSKYATAAADMLRKIQEDLAEGEENSAEFYHKKGGNGYFASATRATNLVDTYPLYSRADDALWLAADDYNQMGVKFDNQQAAMYARIVRDYPLSPHAEDAKTQLRAMGRAVPDADPVMEARMKFELENLKKPGFLTRAMIPFIDRPDTHAAAKSGNPQMDTFKPGMPLDVPEAARGGVTGENTVTIGQPNRDILDKAPDARATTSTTPPAAGDAATDKSAAPAGATTPTAPATPAATPVQETKPGEGSIAVTAANAQAKMIAARKAKPPKQVAPKRRPKPSDRKSTAPAPATTPVQTTQPAAAPATAPATGPAKTSGNGGGGPQAPQQ
jgi:outer membrane protein assembly factor BamD